MLTLLTALIWFAAAQAEPLRGGAPKTSSAVEAPIFGVYPAPPGSGTNPALQGANTPFGYRRFKLSLSENDIVFSDKGLSQYLEFLYTAPLTGSLLLNTALKFEIVTPILRLERFPDGTEVCCTSPGVYHYPLYLESQFVGRVPLARGLNLRVAGQLQAGVDAPEEIGGPVQNAWHDLIIVPHFDAVGDAAFYGGLGGSALLGGRVGAFGYFVGSSLNLTTLQRAAGVLGGLSYTASRVTLQAFAVYERLSSRYFTDTFEPGYRTVTGLSAALALKGAKVKGWTPVLGFTVLYDYNSVVPELSNLRYTFVPDLQFSLPIPLPRQ